MLYVKEKKKINEAKEDVKYKQWTIRYNPAFDGYNIVGTDPEGGANDLYKSPEEAIDYLKRAYEGIQRKEYKPGQDIEYTLKDDDNIPKGMKVGDKIKGKIKKVKDNKADIEWQNKDLDQDFDLSKV